MKLLMPNLLPDFYHLFTLLSQLLADRYASLSSQKGDIIICLDKNAKFHLESILIRKIPGIWSKIASLYLAQS